MKIEVNVGVIIVIEGKYFICKDNFASYLHCNLCGFKMFDDECIHFECSRLCRSDKKNVYFERIEPVPNWQVKAIFDKENKH